MRIDQPSPLLELFAEFEHNNRELLRYESMLDDEKRELIDIVCSNFSVQRENVAFTLRTPYKEIAEIEDDAECAPDRDKVRAIKILAILKKVFESRMAHGGDHPLSRP